jgi:hypothetical protein
VCCRYSPDGDSILALVAKTLFEAAAMPVQTHLGGKIEAYKALCRVMTAPYTRPVGSVHVCRFVVAVRSGLESHPAVVHAIIEHSPGLFSSRVRGISVLVPDVLDVAERVLCVPTDEVYSRSGTTRREVIACVSSLIGYAQYTADGGGFTAVSHRQISRIILGAIESKHSSPSNVQAALWIAAIVVCAAASSEAPAIAQAINTETMMLLMRIAAQWPACDVRVALTLLDVLSYLAGAFGAAELRDHQLARMAMDGLSSLLLSLMEAVRGSHAGDKPLAEKAMAVAAAALYALSDWLMAAPAVIVDDLKLLKAVFAAVVPFVADAVTDDPASKEAEPEKSSGASGLFNEFFEGLQKRGDKHTAQPPPQRRSVQPVSAEVHEACMYFWTYVSHHFLHFPDAQVRCRRHAACRTPLLLRRVCGRSCCAAHHSGRGLLQGPVHISALIDEEAELRRRQPHQADPWQVRSGSTASHLLRADLQRR